MLLVLRRGRIADIRSGRVSVRLQYVSPCQSVAGDGLQLLTYAVLLKEIKECAGPIESKRLMCSPQRPRVSKKTASPP